VFDRRSMALAALGHELESECVRWCRVGLMCRSPLVGDYGLDFPRVGYGVYH
jgi:hypothetical protein